MNGLAGIFIGWYFQGEEPVAGHIPKGGGEPRRFERRQTSVDFGEEAHFYGFLRPFPNCFHKIL
jgi:hypothetical protein